MWLLLLAGAVFFNRLSFSCLTRESITRDCRIKSNMTDGFKYGNDKIMADIFFLGSVRGCSGERSENRRLRLVEGAQDAAAAEDPA